MSFSFLFHELKTKTPRLTCLSLASYTTIIHSFIVAPFVVILSFGNTTRKQSFWEIALGFAAIGLLIFFPALYDKISLPFLRTTNIGFFPNDDFTNNVMDGINIFIGSVLLLFQCCNIARWAVSDDKLTSSEFLTTFLRGSGVKAEFALKQATIKKVHNMMENALDLHFESEKELSLENKDEILKPNKQTAILNYLKDSGK